MTHLTGQKGVSYRLLMPHWSIFGHTRQSSGMGMSFDIAFRKPVYCAHFAGDSKTLLYSIGLMPMTFRFSVFMSIFDMQ